MIEFSTFLVILLISISTDLIGDYLWRMGKVDSICIGGFHIHHELAYLSVPMYLALAWFGAI